MRSPSLTSTVSRSPGSRPHSLVPVHKLVVDLAAVSRSWALPSEAAQAIRNAAPADWEVVVATTPAVSDGDGGTKPSPQVLDAMRQAEAYFGFGLPRDLFLAAPGLKWVHSASAGVGSLLYPEMLASDVVVTNSAVVMGDPIAEQALAGILYFVRNLDIAVDQQRRGEWNKAPFVDDASRARELSECRALLVGMGGIGEALARRLSGLGCPCVGVRRHPDRPLPAGFRRAVPMDGIDAELPNADIVVLATPLTPLTR
ncbi:partial D-specific alpha-keto acid dehydrogenase, partial [Planctomycetaceae bacterium]